MQLLSQHPIGKLIPAMDKKQYVELEEDIVSNGLTHPIILYQNQVLDGWHRFNVCISSSIDPRFETYIGNSPVAYVVSSNAKRRHLNPSQLACIAVEAEDPIAKEAKERQATSTGGKKPQLVAKLPQAAKPRKTRDIVAEMIGVSPRYISDAKRLKEESPDEYDKLKAGAISMADVHKAKKQKKLEAKKQQIVEQTRAAITSDNKPSIVQMDCVDYLKTFKDSSIQLLLTDPPYSTDVKDIASFVESWLPLALSKVKPDGRCYICAGAYPKEVQAYLAVLLKQDKFIVDNPLIWTYRNTLGVTPKMKYNLNYQMIWHLYSEKSPALDTSITNEMFSVQDINAPDGRLGNRYHTWQKPSELARRLIIHSTKPSDLIVDPFACTGTFIIEAAKLGRVGKGCDISKDNIAIAVERGCVC